jgi:hypothetical protein
MSALSTYNAFDSRVAIKDIISSEEDKITHKGLSTGTQEEAQLYKTMRDVKTSHLAGGGRRNSNARVESRISSSKYSDWPDFFLRSDQ